MIRKLIASALRLAADLLDRQPAPVDLGVPVDYDGPVLTPEAREMLVRRPARQETPDDGAPLRGSLEARLGARRSWPRT